MDNNSKYRIVAAALSVGLVLLLGSTFSYAKEANPTLTEQEQSAQSVVYEKVSLNHSDLSQLETLKGIGETKAQAIVTYRQQFGDFKSIDELANVSGIGEKVINENKMRLSL